MSVSRRYEEMLPVELAAAIEATPVAFVPAGLLEWHGDHLPLGLDGLKAHSLCEACAETLGGGVVLPTVFFGRPGYSSYAGTLTYSEGCIDTLFTELFGELAKVGFRVITVLTGHYGPCQVDCLKRVAAYFEKANPQIRVIAKPEYEGVDIDGEVPADHAGKWETSLFQHYYPALVRMDRFKMVPDKKKLYETPPNRFYNEPEEWVWREDLRVAASAELGRRVAERVAAVTATEILKSLEELGLRNRGGAGRN